MDPKFLETLAVRHLNVQKNIDEEVEAWGNELFSILFPTKKKTKTSDNIKDLLAKSKDTLASVIEKSGIENTNGKQISKYFFNHVPSLYQQLRADLIAKFRGQKSQIDGQNILKVYPGFGNIFYYRIANLICRQQQKQLAAFFARSYSGKNEIYIHEGASIEQGFVIQNGKGIQIDENVKIGKRVKIYDGVSVVSINKQAQTNIIIQDEVVLYSGAKILGGKTIIGHGSIIGSGVCLAESVLPNSLIVNKVEIEISKNSENKLSIQNIIGNTAMVEVKKLISNPNVKIYAKLEGQNPGGSVKDRPAYNMIKQALQRGEIKPGMKLIEPTSGNTGIALAMIACMFDLDIQLVMPENSTAERVQTMEAYGAKVILTPAKDGIEGSRDYAQAQVAKGGYKMLNQFANTDNYMAHYHSTGPEIWRDTKGKITHFVSSMGTTGTIMGTSMYLKQKDKNVQIVGVQPTQGSKIPGIRRWTPEYLPKIFNRERVDQIIDVSEEESLVMMRRMAKEQAIFAGVSSGGAMAAAVKLANILQKGVIVTIVCDRGDRYLSSGIFTSEQKL